MDFTSKAIGNGLSDSQEQALETIIKWYKSDSPVFALYGRAGTGKTYVINQVLRELNTNVCVTAPTHKAVRVIENMTGRKGKTLQSLHGLRPNTNLETFDLHNLQFDALGSPTLQNYNLIICDECGMINTDLHALNLKRAIDSNVKILYVGDPLQLPPIKERISPTFLVADRFELTEIIRQASDNPLMNILNLLVYDVKNNSANFLQYLVHNRHQVNSNNEGYKLIINLDEFNEIAVSHFKSEEFSKNTDYTRIACWKNETVNKYNNTIRHSLIPYFNNSEIPNNQKLDILDPNDLFIGYRTIQNEFNDTSVINSEDYIIKAILPRMHPTFNFRYYQVDLYTKGKKLPVEVNIVDHTDKTFISYYQRVKTLYLNAIYANAGNRKAKWQEYYQFKNTYLTILSFDILQGDQVRTTVNKDLDYAFALTIHKLQGSTVNHTFVDLRDIMYFSTGQPVLSSSNMPYATEIRNKLIYTAISRTSEFAYISFPLAR